MNSPVRRGACPGLSAPMPTGDGLLLRMMPIGTIPLAAFVKLCAAAQTHGNDVMEITARGSIQVRGLNAASAPRFAAAIAALGIAAEDGIPVLSNALAGIDPEEILDAGALAADLRRALARRSLAARLAPKISVVIDGGGTLNLDSLAADVRLRAEATNRGVSLCVGIGGDGASAVQLGAIAPAHGVEAVVRALEVIAQRGRDARACDVFKAEGVTVFQAALSSCPALCRASTSHAQSEPKDVDGRDIGERSDAVLRTAMPGHDGVGMRGDAIGLHRLRDGSLACGVGLAFGHADAASLERLAEAAGAAGATGVRAAAARALMIIGLTHETLSSFVAAAERLGFIVRADDPRRHVVACAGAPICSSAHIAARAIAPAIAQASAPHLDRSFTIHISGCAKGCAHPAPNALTVVGTSDGCALIADGCTRDAPFAIVPADQLPAAIATAVWERRHV